MNIMHNSAVYVNTGTLRGNVISVAASLQPGTKIIPVLKCNAYGLGMVECARALAGLPVADTFAVAHVSEGLTLRDAGIREEILVLGNPAPHLLKPAADAGLTLTVGRTGLLPVLAGFEKPCRAELKLDTGLHRVGVKPGEELAEVLRELKDAGEHIRLTGVYSHFADNENKALCETQFKLYMDGLAQISDAGFAVPRRHICDSAGSENFPEYHLDAVRLGRRLMLDHPTRPNGSVKELASWRSCITDIRRRCAGEKLGYGGSFTLEADADIAVIGVGYGDGLPTELVKVHGDVLIGGNRCRLLACCMDQCMADVTGVSCAIGDEVTFFGWDSRGSFLSAQEVAASYGGNEGCAITAALSPRVERIYTE